MAEHAKGEGFWNWLAANCGRIEAALQDAAGSGADHDEIASDLEALMGEVHAELQHWDERALPLFSVSPDKTIELIVTADGDVSAFDAIRTMIAAAPQLPGWRFTALKPRMAMEDFRELGLHIDGQDVTTDDVTYAVSQGTDGAAIFLAFDERLDLDEDGTFIAAGAFLDQLLGEEAASRIGSVDCGRSDEFTAADKLKPLWELRAELDRLWRQ